MILAIAVAVVVLLAWKWMAFRAYSVFCLLMAGIALLIAGWGIKTPAMSIAGAVCTAAALVILYGTSLSVEKSRRKSYMGHLFLWGMLIFVKICLICTIILIPLVKLVAMPLDMQKAIVVDSFGSRIRETYVDQDDKDLLTGDQLKKF